MKDTNLPEAAAVAYTNIKTPSGYHWSFTMRSSTVGQLVEQIEKMEEIFKAKVWEAEEIRYAGSKGGYPKKEVEYGKNADGTFMTCQKCGGKLLVKYSKTDIKKENPFYPCENGKYDFNTKQKTGCDYVYWNKDNAMKVASENKMGNRPSSTDLDEYR